MTLSCLSSLDIAEISTVREDALLANFAPEELLGAGGMKDRTVAGFVALKRSLAALSRDHFNQPEAVPSWFVLGRESSGAPALTLCVGGSADFRERIVSEARISMSHSKKTAYGLAALSEVGLGG